MKAFLDPDYLTVLAVIVGLSFLLGVMVDHFVLSHPPAFGR